MTTKQHQITGVGPTAPDGSVELFTVAPKPLRVDAKTLEAWDVHPTVGDTVQEDEDGTLSLNEGVVTKHYKDGTSATGKGPLPDLSPDEQDAETKKAYGSAASGDGSEPSQLLTYVAKPFTVQAGEITAVAGVGIDTTATLTNGVTVKVNPAAKVGDFYVVDDKGGGVLPAERFNAYFNPK